MFQVIRFSVRVMNAIPKRTPPAAFATLLGIAFAAICPVSASAVETPWLMYEDPVLHQRQTENGFPPKLVDCWLQAMARPEREMKRRAALAVVRGAAKGVPGLEKTVDPLCRILSDPDQDHVVHLTAARALVALEAKEAAPALIEATRPDDLEMAEVVESALARWKDPGLRDRWRERLDGEIGLRRMHILAIRGLVALKERDAVARLRQFALDSRTPLNVRLEAADALGILQDSGLLEEAQRLSGNQTVTGLVDRLVAVRMVAAHRGGDAEAFLVQAAADPEPSIAAAALRNLYQIDPGLILPIVEEVVASKDAKVRRWGAEALVARPSNDSIVALAPLLDDPDPRLRRDVCDWLLKLAETSEFREKVIGEGRRVLAADGWRGQEQATLLLVTLDDKTIAHRLVEILSVSRREANVAAAWGLCELAVPDTAAPVFAFVEKTTESWLAQEPQEEGLDRQIALLCQTLGVLKHSPADEVLRKYIPKGVPLGEKSRAAAIWALGHLHAGQVDEALADQFEKRLLDAFHPQVPECWLVSRMSAVGLGRMKASKNVPALRSALDRSSISTDVGYASAWALWQITGEEIPAVTPVLNMDQDWFLTPAWER